MKAKLVVNIPEESYKGFEDFRKWNSVFSCIIDVNINREGNNDDRFYLEDLPVEKFELETKEYKKIYESTNLLD